MPLDPDLLRLLEGEVPTPAPRPVVGVDVSDRTYDGPHGPISVRVYRSERAPAEGAPALVWNHGGGWVGGDLDMPEADATSRRIALGIDGVVVSVDYRLVPDHVFPVPADDVVAAFEATHAAARELGIEAARIGLGGASAGGHLSALAAARATPTPRATLLVYPATDPPAGPYDERPTDCRRRWWFDRDSTLALFAGLLGPDRDAEDAPPESLPAVSARGGHLPPTLITTAGAYDGLTAQALRYAQLLREDGVAVTVHDVDGVIHGYLNLVGILDRADEALDRHIGWLRENLR
jgi:acetyl esterase/lipase